MKKCPVCSREYRDVVSLCPFDGAGLAPASATPPSVEPQAEFVEPVAITPEVEMAPIVEPVELFPVNIVAMAPETAQFERPPLYDMPEEDLDEAVTEIMAEPPRVAAPTTLLSEPPRDEPDMEATFIRAPITIPLEEEPAIPPSPPSQDYRPNAANAASLPYANEYAESNRGFEPNVPPVISPLGAGRPPMPPARESNPWQWATFGLAGLILVFAGAWFFLGGSRPGANANDPLATDPNAANVNPAPPITGMENGLPPPDANINSGNFNSLPLPLPGAGTGPSMGGSTGPFPSGPPPSLGNINSVYPPPVINSNAPNANQPNFNSGGIKVQPTPLPATTPKPLTTPSVAPTPLGTPKPSASPKPATTPLPAASPKPSIKPAASPKPSGTPSGPEPLR